MNPTDWTTEMRRVVDAHDWDALSQLRKRVNGNFTSAHDPKGLRSFYAAAIASSLPPDKAATLIDPSTEDFQSTLRASLIVVADKVKAQPSIKGVYFEYYYDGTRDEANAGNFFLCDSYSPSEDEWGSDFGEDGFVEGAQLPEFFPEFDPDEDDFSRMVAEEAANAFLLAAVLEEWIASGLVTIPFGFANHDHEMVRTMA